MTSDVTTGVIAGASAIGGGLIVAVSSFVINRTQARDAHKRELRGALAALLHALARVDLQLKSEPQSKKVVRTVNEQMAKRFPQLDYVTGRLHRRIFEPQLDTLSDEITKAMALVLLIAPYELLAPIETVNSAMVEVDPADPAWHARWGKARADLLVASRRVLGEAVGPQKGPG